MEKISLKRVFIYKKAGRDIRLEDPDPQLAPEKVGVFYSGIHPELVNSSVTGPKYTEDGEAVYTLSSSMGRKG